MRIQKIVSRILDEHDCSPGASTEELAAAEHRLGFSLPAELRFILAAANGIRFWQSSNFPCELLPVQRIGAVRDLMDEPEGPLSIVGFLEAEGNFVGIDLDPKSASFGRIIDCWHETFPYELSGICDSIADAMELILNSNGEDWCWPAVLAYTRNSAE